MEKIGFFCSRRGNKHEALLPSLHSNSGNKSGRSSFELANICTGFGWDRVNFFLVAGIVWICAETSVDNTGMF